MTAFFRHLARVRSDKKQRTSLVFLSIFSIAVLVLMFLQMRNQIYSPFAYHGVIDTSTVAVDTTATDYAALLSTPKALSQLSPSETIKLQTTDTDKDGLSDYDEIYVYKTSPFLEDSDSDGFSDKQEVSNGTDPNCPQGQTCRATDFTPTATTTATSDLVSSDLTSALDTTDTANSPTASSTLEEKVMAGVMSGNADTAVLRKLLLDNGVAQKDLDKISDADLLKSYEETLNNMSSQTQTNGQ